MTETASAERGKWLFESRGCLACHAHEAFPTTADQGPDLTRTAAKLNNQKGALWLYSWLKQPHRYHARTKMPELYLDPIVEKDAQNQPTGKVTDPAADIAAFLLGSPTGWKPGEIPAREWQRRSPHGVGAIWPSSGSRAMRFLLHGRKNSWRREFPIRWNPSSRPTRNCS